VSSRERKLWAGAAACLAAIYTAIFFARPLVDFLRARGALRYTVLGVFAIAALAVLWRVWRSRPGWREVVAVGAAAVLYALVVSRLERHEERLHFIEYGLFAGLVEAAFRERRPGWSGLLAIGVTLCAGWLDEGIQALVPERVYDLRDVLFNTTAGILAVLAVTLRRLARAGAPG
jgi:VanZ family protein